MLTRSLVLPVEVPGSVMLLLREYRVMVNEAIRFSLLHDVRSRGTMRPAYAQLRSDHPGTASFYAANARDDALTHLKEYRKRIRKGLAVQRPYQSRLAMRVDAAYLKLDVVAGTLSFPLRAGEHVTVPVALSQWHRAELVKGKLGACIVTPHMVILTVRSEAPVPFAPEGALGLDTNEGSLDGVEVHGDAAGFVTVPFPAVRVVQATYAQRRRRLARAKQHDRRVQRRLLRQEGRRELARVRQRLHRVSKHLIAYAQEHRLAIVLEDLTVPGGHTQSRRLNRRLSSWPRTQLHSQIQYKAEAAGVTIIKVNPRNTSKTCPVCGSVNKSRGRAGRALYTCPCGWQLDRQLNAGINVLQTAVATNHAVARVVRFQPTALAKDAVKPLYHPQDQPWTGARVEPRPTESEPMGAPLPAS